RPEGGRRAEGRSPARRGRRRPRAWASPALPATTRGWSRRRPPTEGVPDPRDALSPWSFRLLLPGPHHLGTAVWIPCGLNREPLVLPFTAAASELDPALPLGPAPPHHGQARRAQPLRPPPRPL